jgi:hypothetical protein
MMLSASGTISRNCCRRIVRLIGFTSALSIFFGPWQLKAIAAEKWKSLISSVGAWRALGQRSDDVWSTALARLLGGARTVERLVHG